MLGSMRSMVAVGAVSIVALGVGCGSKGGDDDGAGATAGTGGATAGGAGGTTGGSAGQGSPTGGTGAGGSAGKGGTAGSAGLGTTAGTGGSSGGTGGSTSGCTSIHLADGETGPNGLVQVYKSASSSAFVAPVGMDGDYAYFADGFSTASTLSRLSLTSGMVEKLGTMNGGNATIRNGIVYYASADQTTNKVTISSAPVTDLTKTTTLVEDLTTLQQNLIVDETSVYWSENQGGGVWSVPLAGGTPKNLASASQPLGMVLQGDDVYWLDFNSEYLERVPKAGGTVENLTEIFFGGPMAADADAIYWLDSSANTLSRWALGASTPTTLASFDVFDDPDALIVDGGNVYYALGFVCAVAWKIGADGSGKTELAQGFNSVGLIGVDATHLYITSMGGVYRVDR